MFPKPGPAVHYLDYNLIMRLLAGIFLCSVSALSFEVALIRVFSISLWYHFAFMVISMAMLGMGLGGTVMSLFSRLREPGNISLYGLFLAASIPVCYLAANLMPFDPVRLSWDRVQILYICLYYTILSAPFFFFGLIMSASLGSFSQRSGAIYGADLLGAGAGALFILLLMGDFGPERSFFLLSALASSGSLLMAGGGRRWIKTSAVITGSACLAVFLAAPPWIEARMSPYKGLKAALIYPGAKHIKTYLSAFGRVDTFRSPMARYAPGLSLRYLKDLPDQIGLSVDGDSITAITESVKSDFYGYLPASLPYEIGRRQDVLLIDPRGGLPALVARHYGAENVWKTESNPLVVDVIERDFGVFSGGIYSDNTWKGLGRSLLKRYRKSFDLIDVSLTEAVPSGHFGMAEDYRFTVEAFGEYLLHLKPEGLLSLNLFIIPPPRAELRLLSTAARALEETGAKDVRRHIAAIRSWGSICILIKKTPFSPDEISAIRNFAASMRFDVIYHAGVDKEDTNRFVKMPAFEYYEAFRDIIGPGTREGFLKNYVFDVREVRDKNPFFRHHLKIENISETYEIMGRKWQYFIEEGYLLPFVFLQVAILSALIVLLPLLRKTHSPAGGRFAALSYFAFIGLGFMFTEITLVHRMILPLENPSYAFSAVIASVLIGSGAGSLISRRVSPRWGKSVPLLLSFIAVLYVFFMPFAIDFLLGYPLWVKMAFSFFLIFPLGLIMGMPFPIGIRSMEERLVPWAWAVNGCFSVISPVLGVMAAMVWGFGFVLFAGGLTYLLAFFSFRGAFEPRLS